MRPLNFFMALGIFILCLVCMSLFITQREAEEALEALKVQHSRLKLYHEDCADSLACCTEREKTRKKIEAKAREKSKNKHDDTIKFLTSLTKTIEDLPPGWGWGPVRPRDMKEIRKKIREKKDAQGD